MLRRLLGRLLEVVLLLTLTFLWIFACLHNCCYSSHYFQSHHQICTRQRLPLLVTSSLVLVKGQAEPMRKCSFRNCWSHYFCSFHLWKIPEQSSNFLSCPVPPWLCFCRDLRVWLPSQSRAFVRWTPARVQVGLWRRAHTVFGVVRLIVDS